MADYSEKNFNIKKLGSFYEKDKTTFKVFAPEIEQLFIIINNHSYEMHKKDYIFQICLVGDLELVKYHFQTDKGVTFRDPFSYFSDENDSYVLDTDKFEKSVILPEKIDDIFIYETSVRDFSSDDSYIGKYRKKFLSLVEEGLKLHDYYMIGLDYIKNLGYTHIQLMPAFEFDNDKSEYNWGYNPLSYNYVEKDYVYDDTNPYAYINELRSVVNTLHKNNIRVSLDAVFNHVYDAEKFDLEKMNPGHTFRYKEDGSLAQGSFCGNEINSQDPFMRAYIIEMIERYIFLFDIDGIRFDLMGLIDYETINKAYIAAKEYKDDFIIYGEGWNMGDVLAEDNRATIINAQKMRGISFFNDYFRDNIINYVCGNDTVKENIKACLMGDNNNLNINQTINYVECHDNLTFFDRLTKYMGNDSLENNIRRCKLALSLCIVARGIPFIHSGQEFLRTKKLVENSYNSGDAVNNIDWDRRVEYNDICDYVKQLIELRKVHGEFVNDNSNVYFEDYYDCLVYNIDSLKIIINPTNYNYEYKDGKNHEVIFNQDGKCEYFTDLLLIPAHCLAICKM